METSSQFCNSKQNMFAIVAESGKVVHVSELDISSRGKKCNCICPLCRRQLVAKMGNVKIHHFAHLADEECGCSAEKANESALHKLAKEIFESARYVILPEIWVDGTDDPDCDPMDERQIVGKKYTDNYCFSYDTVEMEKKEEDFIPDIKLKSVRYNRELIVEIAVTHFIDEEKRKKIVQRGIATIEIDLSDFYLNSGFSRESLKTFLLDETDRHHKKWIYNRKLYEQFFPDFLSRNRKYREEKEKISRLLQQREERKRQWVEDRKREQRKCEDNTEAILNDETLYMVLRETLRNDTESERAFRECAFFREAVKIYGGLPYFCNIPVKGEIAFKCDRRIWQLYLFEKFVYKRKPYGESEGIRWIRIYIFFYKSTKWSNALNDKYIYKKNRADFLYSNSIYVDDLLSCAIKEYLTYLSGLGFISPNINCDGFSDFIDGYGYTPRILLPPTEESRKYGENLYKRLKSSDFTKEPFPDLWNSLI